MALHLPLLSHTIFFQSNLILKTAFRGKPKYIRSSMAKLARVYRWFTPRPAISNHVRCPISTKSYLSIMGSTRSIASEHPHFNPHNRCTSIGYWPPHFMWYMDHSWKFACFKLKNWHPDHPHESPQCETKKWFRLRLSSWSTVINWLILVVLDL